ncbi:L-cysteine desulfurase [Gammaproteobacteria bacterium]
MNTKIREQFPILQEKVQSKPLVYLDNAATSQKPRCVIEAMDHFYFRDNSNIHRGVHTLAERATRSYEQSRKKVQRFINAKNSAEIIFVRGTTEAINLVAQSYGRKNFHADDEVIISTMEHHSNIVPWQLICEQIGAKLQVVKIRKNGELDLDHYEMLLNNRTKMVAITHVSNTLGTINPIKKIITLAHAHNIPVLIDGAQAVPHMQIDVQNLDCDFYAFSAHKMYGPTGVGVLYGKETFLDAMPPYQGGGDMIKKVTFEKTEYGNLPHKFEAGTQNIAGVIGLGAAIDFLNSVGMDKISQHEKNLLNYANKILAEIKKLRIIGNTLDKVGVISFVLDKVHPHDIATVLDTEGVAVRAGHHCTMPLMDFYNIPATTRVSFGVYNTEKEIDIFATAINKVKKILRIKD